MQIKKLEPNKEKRETGHPRAHYFVGFEVGREVEGGYERAWREQGALGRGIQENVKRGGVCVCVCVKEKCYSLR